MIEGFLVAVRALVLILPLVFSAAARSAVVGTPTVVTSDSRGTSMLLVRRIRVFPPSAQGITIRDGLAIWATSRGSASHSLLRIHASALLVFRPRTIADTGPWAHGLEDVEVSNQWFVWAAIAGDCTWSLWAKPRWGGWSRLVARQATLYTGPPTGYRARRTSPASATHAGGAGCPDADISFALYGETVVWGGNGNGPAPVRLDSLPTLRQCLTVRSRTGRWDPQVAGRMVAWLRAHSCGRAPGLPTEMIYLSTGVVHGRRLPISRADIGALQKQIGRRYVAWITKRGRLVAFDLVTGRLRVLARSARFSPFFLQGSLIAWQRADDDSVHAADLRTGRRLAVSQAWCARETYDCSLVGIAPGGMLALDVLHSNREDTALLWEELALERPA